MNKLNERLVWISVIIFGVFMIENQSNNNANMEMILKTYHAETQIQKSEIADFHNQLYSARDNSYLRGFEAGKTQAGIAFVKGESLYNYADGYHAGVSQFAEPLESNKSTESLLAELLVDFMDHELSAEESYWELLEYMTEDPSLKANAE
jgi:hypothetical protein